VYAASIPGRRTSLAPVELIADSPIVASYYSGSFARGSTAWGSRRIFSGENFGSNIQSGSEIRPPPPPPSLHPDRISRSDPRQNFLQPRKGRAAFTPYATSLYVSPSLSLSPLVPRPASRFASLKLKVPRCRRVESLRKVRSRGFPSCDGSERDTVPRI